MLLSTIIAVISLLIAILSGFIALPLWAAVFLLASAFLISQRGQ